MANTQNFTGLGRLGDWTDAANWGGKTAPGALDFAVVPMSTTMNGSFASRVLMFLGQETVTINGAITTTSTALCESFMVCDEATAVFTPGSSLLSAGGLQVGVDAVGTLIAQGNASAQCTLTTHSAEIGLFVGSNGHMNVDGAIWNDTQQLYVGAHGTGTLTVDSGGVVNVTENLILGATTGSSGTVVISGGGAIHVAGSANVGAKESVGAGVASLAIGTGSSLDTQKTLTVSRLGTLTMAGGTVTALGTGAGLKVSQGAVVSGEGNINAAGGIVDAGVISAAGGTLVLNGAINGSGAIQIGGGSTVTITAATIGRVAQVFAGANATMVLAHGVMDQGVISGFAAGDAILTQGVDQIGWNGSTDVLTLSDAGHVVDTLHFAGSYGSGAFILTQTGAGALIGLATHH
jgi:T5SS/PEP-CTERM-associated repeat protein